ncbi:MAG: hypothetical protein A2138_04040 [Deltaproteobacteria bacterium RBG_16_71_12]|nr:MAG: hypothetical protein A2138_04040 [Deltaproteobacteria bacterium RBG_16_71_12]
MHLYSRKLTVDQLQNFLTEQEHAGGAKAFVLLERTDQRIDWQEFERDKSPKNGSVNVGQLWDFRRSAPGGSALHVHVFAHYVTIHLDVHDPAERPVEHLLGETYLVRGAAVGGGTALLLGLASGPALVLAAFGALLGGNAAVAARYVALARIDWDGTAGFEPIAPDRVRALLHDDQLQQPYRRLRGAR